MEIWKSVPDFEDYMCSNLGRVKSIQRRENGKRNFIRPERIITPNKLNTGYIQIHFEKNMSQHMRLLHRVVAAAFIPNPEKKSFINHINGVKDDNRVENLEWCTRRENGLHAVKMGLWVAPKGEGHANSKLTIDEVKQIRAEYIPFKNGYKKLGEKYGVTMGNIQSIIERRTWNHI